MSNEKMLVHITHAEDDIDRVTVGFNMANASVASGIETIVLFTNDAVHLGIKGFSDKIHEEGHQPLSVLLENFIALDGNIWICNTCFQKRKLNENGLIDGAKLIGGVKVIEYLTANGPTPCLSF